MYEVNPKKNIEVIRANLDKAKGYTTKASDDISFQQDMLEAISPYWKYMTPIPSTGAVSSTAASMELWAQESERMLSDAQVLTDHIALALSVAANVGSSTATLSQFEPNMQQSVSISVSGILNRKLEREKIREALSKISQSLADTFSTIWQYMSIPAFDPGRGPLLQMRQVFDQFLENIAPDNKVESQLDFMPDAQLKKKDGKGITHRHRIAYLARAKVKNESYGRAVINSSQAFTDIYSDLNKLHTRGKLDAAKVKDALTQGEVLLQEWLKALGMLS